MDEAKTKKKPIKILMVGPLPYSELGGVAIAVSNLCKYLSDFEEIEIYLFADNYLSDSFLGWEKVENHFIFKPLKYKITNLFKLITFFGFYNFLKTAIIEPYSKMRFKYFDYERLYQYEFRYLYLKKIIKMIQPYIIHAHHFQYAPISSWLASKGKIPIITTIHSFSHLVDSKKRRQECLKRRYKRIFDISTKLIAISSIIKEEAIKLGANPEKIVIIPNGVDTSLYSPNNQKEARERLNLDKDKKIILFTGTLLPIKGVDVLIKSFKVINDQIKDSLLVIVGEGREESMLKHLVERLNLKKSVMFAGAKPQKEMPLWYKASDVFVLPSKSEGLSISLLEAMACGKPVITTCPEFSKYDPIIVGETGLLVHYGNINELSEKILNVLTNLFLSNKLGEQAHKIIVEKYNWDIISRETRDIYINIFKGDTPKTGIG